MGVVLEFKPRVQRPLETAEQIAARVAGRCEAQTYTFEQMASAAMIYDGIVLPDLSEASHYHAPNADDPA